MLGPFPGCLMWHRCWRFWIGTKRWLSTEEVLLRALAVARKPTKMLHLRTVAQASTRLIRHNHKQPSTRARSTPIRLVLKSLSHVYHAEVATIKQITCYSLPTFLHHPCRTIDRLITFRNPDMVDRSINRTTVVSYRKVTHGNPRLC